MREYQSPALFAAGTEYDIMIIPLCIPAMCNDKHLDPRWRGAKVRPLWKIYGSENADRSAPR
jgi:hypothetical protein